MNVAGTVAALAIWCVAASGGGPAQAVNHGTVTHLVNGLWFDGTTFVKQDFYVEGQYLTQHPDERRSYATVDLHGGYVVPPYGDAHEHNFDGLFGTDAVVKQYLADGIFYAQGMTDTTVGAAETVKAGLVNTPTSVDVTYAHGGLTGVNGHPKEVYEALAHGFNYPRTDEQRQIVIAGTMRAGGAYWEIKDTADLDAKWPLIVASKPDLIKVLPRRLSSLQAGNQRRSAARQGHRSRAGGTDRAEGPRRRSARLCPRRHCL